LSQARSIEPISQRSPQSPVETLFFGQKDKRDGSRGRPLHGSAPP